jgi:hypothetical protein
MNPDVLFYCPPAATLEDIPDFECAFRFDQVQRFFFQRLQAVSSFTAATIILGATWTPLLAAEDDTKIVKTPRLANVIIPPGEILKEGGNDNTTLDGIPRLNGRGFSPVTIDLLDMTPAILSGIRALANESVGASNIILRMVNRFGQIISHSDGDGIPVYNIMVGDIGTEGFGKPNVARLTFDLPPGWSDNVQMFVPTPPFNPLTV